MPEIPITDILDVEVAPLDMGLHDLLQTEKYCYGCASSTDD